MNTEIPENWGEDPLSEFIEAAHHNCIATFVNYRDLPVMKALKEVDALFRCVLRIPYKPKEEILLPSFIGRSHSAYLSGILLSTAGQVPEAYPAIRLCLENALYGFFIQDDPTIHEEIPERSKIWLDRGKSDNATRMCRNTFTYGGVRDRLISRDNALGKHAAALYQRTITYGAHPNFYAHATTSDLVAEGEGNIQYLLPNTDACKLCIQTAVETGLCSLRIYGLILQDRFSSAGIPERIQRIDWKNQNVERI